MQYQPEFEGAYLEDSYLMGIVAEGSNLRLKMLFVLTTDHPAYSVPTGEARCYREGSILVEQPAIIEWHPGRPRLTSDADDTFDLGSLEMYRAQPNRYRFVTEWFDATVDAPRVSIALD